MPECTHRIAPALPGLGRHRLRAWADAYNSARDGSPRTHAVPIPLDQTGQGLRERHLLNGAAGASQEHVYAGRDASMNPTAPACRQRSAAADQLDRRRSGRHTRVLRWSRVRHGKPGMGAG